MLRISSRWLVVPATVVGVAAIVFAEPKDGSIPNEVVTMSAATPEERATARELADRKDVFALRISYKEALVKQLIDGHTTLEIVSSEFLLLNRETPVTIQCIRAQYPGLSDEEGSASNVIDYVRMRVHDGNREAVVARLAAEFRRQYGHDYEEPQ